MGRDCDSWMGFWSVGLGFLGFVERVRLGCLVLEEYDGDGI